MKKDEINISQPGEIKYWCDQLHCEKSDLIYAVNNIGNLPTMVDLFLILNRRKVGM